ncbi:MAG: preprotein translocase subunit SecG [Tepidisphaeraceae bacterium]|jgi:preprotein translocase subunit SecG
MLVLYWIFLPIFLFFCFVMIMLVLVQKGRGGGLSGAFGGAGGNTAFGAKTGDVLTWATSVVFALFVILAVVLNLICDKIGNRTQPTQPVPQVQHVPAGAPASPASPTNGK